MHTLSEVHDFPTQVVAHDVSAEKQDSPVTQSLSKLHDFPTQVVAEVSSPSQQDSLGAHFIGGT